MCGVGLPHPYNCPMETLLNETAERHKAQRSHPC
ncbi:MAG: hypothetical protein V7646_5540, partial [Pseudonocardia sp.]